jgi:hypothetical protein
LFGGLKVIALVRLRLSTKASNTLESKGLNTMPKEAGINLNTLLITKAFLWG